MRPLRFVLLVACFIAIPVFLTCISLIGRSSDSADVFQRPQRSRLRALFSFSTPSALFPPSAIISLTFENSTFFLARPAAFGPSLPSKGLSGQLWIGRGFGDDSLLLEDDLKVSGFELGCSDVPGWGDDQKKTPDNPAMNERSIKSSIDDFAAPNYVDSQLSADMNAAQGLDKDGVPFGDQRDGTDDHLHRPLQDSNPAETTDFPTQDKGRKPTHADIESLQEGADIAGKIVMLSRGGCGFLEKVKWAQRRGGVAVIVGDNERNGALTIMYAKGDTSNITIPAIFTSYTSAHLLSSLVPPELTVASGADEKAKKTPGKGRPKANNAEKHAGPVFTTTTSSKSQATGSEQVESGWVQNVLQAVGLNSDDVHSEDSRRPPGSGNIEWVQVKDWNEDFDKTLTTKTQTMPVPKTASVTKSVKQQTTGKIGNDDFVIGVQDWRDTELIAPKSTSTNLEDGKTKKANAEATNTLPSTAARETLKGGSIIPGSGEYQDPARDDVSHQRGVTDTKNHLRKQDCGYFSRVKSWFGLSAKSCEHAKVPEMPGPSKSSGRKPEDKQRKGLWVTLTPTSVSSSPFFDTLLVLVVSPLVTLTFVYGLLLLRSRIRRRRWRAPKSVVDQLPVRTYHTMSTGSSTASSLLASPNASQTNSPQLRPEPVRSRQRSQTTIGLLSSSGGSSTSPPQEKSRKPQPKKYRGRQIECVVCLEEYVDGESKVMSLPCGHEFHVECITPWLVNRRRTCPICKGDVVRSLQKGGSSSGDDNTEPGEETADDVQERAATTVPDDPIVAAIPIPERPSIMDEDIERGETPLNDEEQNSSSPAASRWRGLLSASVPNMSRGWRPTPEDRDR